MAWIIFSRWWLLGYGQFKLRRHIPAYPSDAKKRGEEGTVVLYVELTEEGKVKSTQIQSSSGYTALDRAALDAVRRWRFQPAKMGGDWDQVVREGASSLRFGEELAKTDAMNIDDSEVTTTGLKGISHQDTIRQLTIGVNLRKDKIQF